MNLKTALSIRHGDILAYRPKNNDLVGKIIDWASWGGGYCHAAIVQDFKAEKNGLYTISVIESNTDCDPVGVRKKTFVYTLTEIGNIDLYRMPCNVADELRVLRWCEDRVGAPYDLLGFPSTWFRSIVCRAFGWRNYGKTKVAMGLEKGYYCSELIATAFFEVTGTEIHNQLHHSAVEPNALFDKNSRLYKVVK